MCFVGEKTDMSWQDLEMKNRMKWMLPSIKLKDSTIIFRTRQNNINFIFRYAPTAFIITNQDWYMQKNEKIL